MGFGQSRMRHFVKLLMAEQSIELAHIFPIMFYSTQEIQPEAGEDGEGEKEKESKDEEVAENDVGASAPPPPTHPGQIEEKEEGEGEGEGEGEEGDNTDTKTIQYNASFYIGIIPRRLTTHVCVSVSFSFILFFLSPHPLPSHLHRKIAKPSISPPCSGAG